MPWETAGDDTSAHHGCLSTVSSPCFHKELSKQKQLKATVLDNIVDGFLKDAAEQISTFCNPYYSGNSPGFAQPREVHCGVPQSTVLGPLLFLKIYNL